MNKPIRNLLIIVLVVSLFIQAGCSFIGSPPMEEEIIEDFVNDKEEEVKDPVDIEIPEDLIFTYGDLPEEIIEKIMGKSYLVNDTVALKDLSYLKVSYWGFDEKSHIGEIIVNKEVAKDLVEIFQELYEVKYPIEKIRLIDEYDADDNLSMEDNNSSSFCFRPVVGSSKLSKHSYGLAIDINPLQNPYVKGDLILPPNGEEYLDRNNVRIGMILEGDACYEAFVSRGWTWGGHWNSLKDYQHFEYDLD